MERKSYQPFIFFKTIAEMNASRHEIGTRAYVTENSRLYTCAGQATWVVTSFGGGGGGGASDTDALINESNVPGFTTTDALNALWSLHNPASITGFTLGASTGIRLVGTPFTPGAILWTGTNGAGSTNGFRLTGPGLAVNPATSPHNGAPVYNPAAAGSATWTVFDNDGLAASRSISVSWIEASYWGKTNMAAPTFPTDDAEVEAATMLVVNTASSIAVNPNTAVDELAWFAVPSSHANYTDWFVDALNKGAIGASEFISLTVVGSYKLYKFSNATELNATLRLS